MHQSQATVHKIRHTSSMDACNTQQSLSHETTEQGASCVGGREDECPDTRRILSITMELCRPRVLHSSLAPWVHIRRGTSARPDTRRPIVGSTPGAARAVSRRQQERIPGYEYHSMVSRVWPQTGGGSLAHSHPRGRVTVLQCLTCCHVTLTWLGSPAPPTAATPTATSASTHPAHSRAASTLPHGTTPAFVHPTC